RRTSTPPPPRPPSRAPKNTDNEAPRIASSPRALRSSRSSTARSATASALAARATSGQKYAKLCHVPTSIRGPDHSAGTPGRERQLGGGRAPRGQRGRRDGLGRQGVRAVRKPA